MNGAAQDADAPRISFVVIGYNEAAGLGACLQSIRDAALDGMPHEILYADGGSEDASAAIAREMGADQVIGGDRRRRAAENRNAGLAAARGEFVQFLDGDMTLDPDWPKAALDVLEADPGVAAVWGRMLEANPSPVYQALQMDWEFPEGPSRYCGGAAMFRRAVIEAAGGFPEDVAYGEEPYLCWRIRNEFGGVIHHLHRTMVRHDLAYKNFADYWRRNVRSGVAFAEIARRCQGTQEPMWSREVRGNLLWAALLLLLAAAAVAGPGLLRWIALAALIGIPGRKFLQCLLRGKGFAPALLYAGHTYLSKLGIAWGILRARIAAAPHQ